jgi:hypothetical protein
MSTGMKASLNTPLRLQRKRTKGFNLQRLSLSINSLEVVSCTRGGTVSASKWANPLRLSDDEIICIDTVYRNPVKDRWVTLQRGTKDDMLKMFARIIDPNESFEDADLHYWQQHFSNLNWDELRGKNLACWCALEESCHVDVLINSLYGETGSTDGETGNNPRQDT